MVFLPCQESQAPDVVKRGADDFEVSDGEAEQVDHLVFLIHGIGPVCDLSFKPVEESGELVNKIHSKILSIK